MSQEIEMHVMDILALVNDHPLHALVERRLRKLFESIDASAERGVVHGNCPYCRSVRSKLHGDE